MKNRMEIETFQASDFMPPLQDTEFYFREAWRPRERDVYVPRVPYTFYDVPALGQINQSSVNLFGNLAQLGVGLYTENEQRKEREDIRDYQLQLQKIKTDAMVAVAKEQARTPQIVQSPGASSLYWIVGGLTFVLGVGTVISLVTK